MRPINNRCVGFPIQPLKWIGKLLVAAMLVVVIVLIAGFYLLTQNYFKAYLADAVYQRTGRHFFIDGALGIKPGWQLVLFAEDLRYQNAAWGKAPSAFTADRIEIAVSLLALLRGDFAVDNATLKGASLWLETNAAGNFNLRPSTTAATSGAPKLLPFIPLIAKLSILDSQIRYFHPYLDWDIQLHTAVLQSTGRDQPVSVQVAGLLQQLPLKIEGKLGTWRSWFERTPSNLELLATAANGDRMTASGMVGDVLLWRGVDVLLTAEIAELRQLSAMFANQPLDLRALQLNARFVQPGSVRAMALADIAGSFSLYGIAVAVNGSVGKLRSMQQIALSLQSDAPIDVANLPENLPGKLPDKLALQASLAASLSGSSSALQLDVERAAIVTDDATLLAHGVINNLRKRSQIAMPFSVELKNLKYLEQLIGVKLPEVGTVTVNGLLAANQQGGWRLQQVDGKLVGEDISVAVSGGIERVSPLTINGLNLKITSSKLDFIASLAKVVKKQHPLLANIALDYQKDRLRIEGQVNVASSDINGELLWQSTAQGANRLTLNLKSKLLNLQELLLKPQRQPRFVSQQSLLPAWAKGINYSLQIAVDRFKNTAIEIDNLEFTSNFSDGELDTRFKGVKHDATIDGRVFVSAANQTAVSLDIKNLQPKFLPSFNKANIFRGGEIDIAINLSGAGNSLVALLQQGEGNLWFDIDNSSINNKALQTVGGDIFSNLLLAINPFSEQARFDKVECGTIHFDVKNGKAVTKDGLALKTDKVTVLGSASIKFPNEDIEIIVVPKPRRGFGISPTSLVKIIRVGGTLNQPKIETYANGLFKSGAAIAAATVTGGLTLLGQGVFDRLQANSNVCEVARGVTQ